MMPDPLFVVVAACTVAGALALCRHEPDQPISRRTLRKINERIDEQERRNV